MAISTRERDDVHLPSWVLLIGAWSWRVLAFGLAIWVLGNLVAMLKVVVIPVVFAVFFTALLRPPVAFLTERRVPPAPAVLLVLVVGLGAVAGIVVVTGSAVSDQVEEVGTALVEGWRQFLTWVADTLPITRAELDRAIDGLTDAAQGDGLAQRLGGGLVTGVEVVVGVVLTIVTLFFLLKDGPRLGAWGVEQAPPRRRHEVRQVFDDVWTTVGSFARGQAFIATVDAVAAYLAFLVLGVPLALPLAVLTLLGGFIPLLGPVLAGAVAALVALSEGGPVLALWVVLAMTAIQQVEGNVLEPLVMGRVLPLHPLVVLLVVAIGTAVAGVIGAFVAVPFTAALVTAVTSWRDATGDT